MGCAITAIVFSHLEHNFVVHNLTPSRLSKILNNGTAGVDIFMFLSGFGLYYSYEKNRPGYVEFIKKRFNRVIPDYLVIGGTAWVITDLLMSKLGFVTFLEDITFISMFTRGVARYWYVFAVCVFYMLFPLVFRCIEKQKHPYRAFILFFAAFWIFTACLHKILPNYMNIRMMIERFPVFVFGTICGRSAKEGKTISVSKLAIICCIFVVGICMRDQYKQLHYAHYFCHGLIAMTAMIAAIPAMEWVESFKPDIYQAIFKFFCFLGGSTLEIYLFHISFRHILHHPYTWPGYFSGLVILPIASSIIYKRIKTSLKKENVR